MLIILLELLENLQILIQHDHNDCHHNKKKLIKDLKNSYQTCKNIEITLLSTYIQKINDENRYKGIFYLSTGSILYILEVLSDFFEVCQNNYVSEQLLKYEVLNLNRRLQHIIRKGE